MPRASPILAQLTRRDRSVSTTSCNWLLLPCTVSSIGLSRASSCSDGWFVIGARSRRGVLPAMYSRQSSTHSSQMKMRPCPAHPTLRKLSRPTTAEERRCSAPGRRRRGGAPRQAARGSALPSPGPAVRRSSGIRLRRLRIERRQCYLALAMPTPCGSASSAPGLPHNEEKKALRRASDL
jgi:hypothetical protein